MTLSEGKMDPLVWIGPLFTSDLFFVICIFITDSNLFLRLFSSIYLSIHLTDSRADDSLDLFTSALNGRRKINRWPV